MIKSDIARMNNSDIQLNLDILFTGNRLKSGTLVIWTWIKGRRILIKIE